MTSALCGICLAPTRREHNPEQTDYCEEHSVTRAYHHFWREWRVDLDQIPHLEKMQEALRRALRVAARLPVEGVRDSQDRGRADA